MKSVLKILFVEDLLTDAELIWFEIKRNQIPFEKLLVDNKKDFIKGLKSFAPDIIISDYSLPQFDGMAALVLRNEHNPLIPFVLVTASINEEIAIDCMKAGADDYVIKGNLSRLGPAIVNSINKINNLKEKQIAENNLRESERKLKEAQSIGMIGSWEYDVEKNSITWSDQTYKLYDRDPALGPPTPDEEAKYYSNEHNEKLRQFAELAIKNGTQFEYDLEAHLPGGKVVCFYSKMRPVKNDEGRVIKLVGVVQDITERKLHEKLIIKASSDWNKTFDSIQDAIVLLDADQQVIISNKAFLDFTGEDKETITSHKCFGYVHHTACPIEGCPFIRMMKSMKRESMELKIHEKNYRVTVDPIFNDLKEIAGAVHIMSDITGLKKTEEALRESESVFRTLIEKMPDGVYKTTHIGKVVEANPALIKILGFESKEELLGVNIGQELYFDASDREKMTIEGMNSDLISYRLRKKDGSEVWVEDHGWYTFDKNGEIIFHEGVLRDITERRHSEAKIKTLGKAIAQSPVSIIITDAEGNIEFVNDKFISGTQYSLVEVKGKKPRIFNQGHLEQDVFDSMWETLHKGNIWRGEFSNRKKDGTIYPEEVTISAIQNQDNSISNYILILEDITDKKKNLDDLINAKEKAEENDQLKTAFLHNISHEIRTPMNAIVGFSDLVTDPDLTSEIRNEYIKTIAQSSDQLLSIITQIVSMATIEAGQEKIYEREISLNSVFKIVSDQFYSEAVRKNISLKYNTTLTENEDIIVTDETKLIQIITNLLGNALKFTKKGSVDFGYVVKDYFLEFYFKDTGIGIPEDLHENIFERFRQVETTMTREYEGSGLGLSISKAYVELLGGKIWLTSTIGVGSVFYFTIPFKKISRNKITEQDVADKYKTEIKRTITLLVAEDEHNNFKLLAHYLSNPNIVLIHAENGSEAVEICKKNKQINLVLMDLKMPVMDGFEATKKIKEFWPELPVIAQTAYVREDDKNKALACGCSDFLSKPFKKEELLKMIGEYLVLN